MLACDQYTKAISHYIVPTCHLLVKNTKQSKQIDNVAFNYFSRKVMWAIYVYCATYVYWLIDYLDT